MEEGTFGVLAFGLLLGLIVVAVRRRREAGHKPKSHGPAPLFEVRGALNTLRVYSARVEIAPSGAIGGVLQGGTGVRQIEYRSVSALEYRKADAFLNGYLRFVHAGAQATGAGLLSAVNDDPNAFCFRTNANATMMEVRKYVQQQVASASLASDQRGGYIERSGLADEITKISALHDTGVLTQEEFVSAKARLIERV